MICRAQLQLSTPPRGKFVPVESLHSRPRATITCFTFTPTAKERCNSSKRGCSLQLLYLVAANNIGTTLDDDNQFRAHFRTRHYTRSTSKLIDRVAKIVVID